MLKPADEHSYPGSAAEARPALTAIHGSDHAERKLMHVEPSGHAQQGLTVWFTGLSGAGKTTLCQFVYEELKILGYKVEMLDADVLRKQFWPDLGFTRADRDENVRRIGLLAELLTRNGIITLVAAISPHRAVRDEVRTKICRFLEVHVDAPLYVCEERDPKGLYRKARAGILRGFTGIDDPYEPPLAPEIRCATGQDTVSTCRNQVISAVLLYLSFQGIVSD